MFQLYNLFARETSNRVFTVPILLRGCVEPARRLLLMQTQLSDIDRTSQMIRNVV